MSKALTGNPLLTFTLILNHNTYFNGKTAAEQRCHFPKCHSNVKTGSKGVSLPIVINLTIFGENSDPF